MQQLKHHHEEPIYLKLANLLEGMIASRSLRPGDRVPSVRQFSAQQRVSIPTALQAYTVMETRGLIEARPKSGFFVRARLSELVPAPKSAAVIRKTSSFVETDPLVSLLADHAGSKLVPLGAALPSADLLPGEKLARTMAAVARKLGPLSTDYDVAPGSEILRREIARRSLEWGGALKPDDLIVTVGATEALFIALRATCKPGDYVVVESPTYFGLARMVHDLGLKALPVPVDSVNGIDLQVLKKTVAKHRVSACVLIPNFHNPVGFVMPDERKKEVVALLSKRGIPIIEDDIYGDLQHQDPRPRCLKAFDPDGSVILCSSYSKTLAPGYRVGYMAAGRWHEKALALKRSTTFSGSLLSTLAIAEFLKNGGYDRYLRSARHAYRQQVSRMKEAIVESFPKGISLSRPQGGFLLWCEMPRKVDSMELFKHARAAGISIAPGPLFSPNGGFRNFIRINCGYPWNPQMERSVGILGHLVRRLL
ncbi:MAG: PLP-dependent aminotransferase family protein [Chthoniobacteraceae bacterium]